MLGMLSRRRVQARRGTDPDAAVARRVGWRLAALTVGLIAALLLVLGVAVYGTMQHVLLQSLQDTVWQRTTGFLQSGRLPGPPGGPGRPPPFRRPRRSAIGDVRFTIANQRLHVLQGLDPDAPATLPDPAAAHQALSGRAAAPWSTQRVDSTGPYLIYTLPVQLIQPDGSAAPGVLQASISEQQYQHSLQALLAVLLGVSLLGLLAAAAISGVLARRALGPIQLALRRQRDFVADAAHELRTPLAIQRTAMELGLAADTGTEQQGTIEQALRQTVHLTRLVDHLSLLARADSGAMTLERAPVDLARLASETAGGVAILAEERGVRLCVEAPQETRVLGDAGRLRQVLLILLDNALKYTPDGGGITVRVARAGGQAQLEVRDSGPGLAPADLPHLFERFYRADKARSSGGTGLGLAIGRWIAEAHGGHIMAANASEGGALFTVTFPLASS
jgi:two-component system, OmpR family, sensor histidine kinase CiaH